MLSRAINEFEVVLNLTSASPLIVKEGRFSLLRGKCGNEKNLPNDIPISRNDDDEIVQAMLHAGRGAVSDSLKELAGFKFYVPGASLRGAWRSWLEGTLRNLEGTDGPKICNPFAKDAAEQSCSNALEKSKTPYARSCPVCRLFGSTAQAGRLDISDAELVSGCKPNILVRDQVAISRVSGGVENKYRIYVLENAKFHVVLRLRNFELLQLHLLGMIVSSIPAIPLGSGKGKGFGRFTCSYVSGTFRFFGRRPEDNRVRGIGEDPVWGPSIRTLYRITERTPPELLDMTTPFWSEEDGNPYRFAHCVTEEKQFVKAWQSINLDFATVRTLAANRRAS